MADFDQELDASGLNCPLPILRAKKTLNGMDAGAVLHIGEHDVFVGAEPLVADPLVAITARSVKPYAAHVEVVPVLDEEPPARVPGRPGVEREPDRRG